VLYTAKSEDDDVVKLLLDWIGYIFGRTRRRPTMYMEKEEVQRSY